eukprot:g31448.t1
MVYASQTLTDTKCKYAQIEKEGLEAIFVTMDNIQLWTYKNPVLAKLKQLVVMGETEGPSQPGLKPFWTWRDQIMDHPSRNNRASSSRVVDGENTSLNLIFPYLEGGDTVLNKHMGHLKAVISQTGQEQNIPGPSEQPEGLAETVSSPPPSSVKETSESEMDAASIPLLPEEEEETLPRCSRRKRRATVRYTLPESEEPDVGRRHRRESYKPKTRPTPRTMGEGCDNWNQVDLIDYEASDLELEQLVPRYCVQPTHGFGNLDRIRKENSPNFFNLSSS